MTGDMFLAIAPHITLTVAILVVMLAISLKRNHAAIAALTVAGFVATAAALVPAVGVYPLEVTPLFILDGIAAFFVSAFVVVAVITVLVSHRYLEGRSGQLEEYYLLLGIATLGAMVLASAQHFAALLLGLEIMSISLYTLIAYPEEGHPPLEAALKYLVLSGVATTTMLFGLGLIYNSTGSLSFAGAFGSESGLSYQDASWLTAGQVMVIIGLGFKLSLVPFHMWTPDIYEGAPAPVTGFLATVAKAAVFAVLLRLAINTSALEQGVIFTIVSIIALLSMIVGNLLALLQNNVKRILAYSSIAHLGYLLIGLLAVAALEDPAMAVETALMFLAGYLAMTLTVFVVISQLSSPRSERDADSLAVLAGLFWRRPLLAGTMTIALLSLAGIPLTAGFIAKFYLFAAGVEGALWMLVWSMIVGSAIAIYYYLKIVFAMTTRADGVEDQPNTLVGAAATMALAVFIILLGTYPEPLIDVVRNIVEGLG